MDMRKKIVAIITICTLAVSMTACGEESSKADESSKAAETTVSETIKETEKVTEAVETTQAAEEKEEKTENEPASDEEFTLLDVSSDMIETGIYAVDDENNELVFSMFTAPDGSDMASLFIYCPDGSGDVICGTYEAETETDEDGIAWTKLSGDDVYTGNSFVIGFAESEDGQVCILDTEGGVYEGEYLSNDDTITYMASAVNLLSDDSSAAEDDAAEDDTAGNEDFTLLDVSSDMIETGIYAVDDENNELVFSMFTAPDGSDMASLFVYFPDGSGDVICGTYEAETETDEDGIAWTKLSGDDVYTGNSFVIGFAESEDGQVCILDAEGDVYEGEYLSNDDTITYMGTAVNLLS